MSEDVSAFDIIELVCDCGNPEQYYLDPDTYELKLIECPNCQSKMEL